MKTDAQARGYYVTYRSKEVVADGRCFTWRINLLAWNVPDAIEQGKVEVREKHYHGEIEVIKVEPDVFWGRDSA